MPYIMSPMNTFGSKFRVTTAGESHGPAMVAIVDGCPAGLALAEADIQADLDQRKPGQANTSPRQEADQVQILSGVFEGKTLGTPIALLINNTDAKSKDYSELKNLFRPGHADYTYFKKYGHRDYRGGGRASARETVLRVAAGAIAKKILAQQGIVISAFVDQIGELYLTQQDWRQGMPEKVATYLQAIKQQGDSIGAGITVIGKNIPVGLGEPVYGKLDAQLAAAMMSINAAKGVEIGSGFAAIAQKGSQARDEMTPDGFLSNHNGGVLGGISSGQDLIVRVAFKPTSSIAIPGKSIDINGNSVTVATQGRHDPCVGVRAVPVCEAMMAIVLANEVC